MPAEFAVSLAAACSIETDGAVVVGVGLQSAPQGLVGFFHAALRRLGAGEVSQDRGGLPELAEIGDKHVFCLRVLSCGKQQQAMNGSAPLGHRIDALQMRRGGQKVRSGSCLECIQQNGGEGVRVVVGLLQGLGQQVAPPLTYRNQHLPAEVVENADARLFRLLRRWRRGVFGRDGCRRSSGGLCRSRDRSRGRSIWRFWGRGAFTRGGSRGLFTEQIDQTHRVPLSGLGGPCAGRG